MGKKRKGLKPNTDKQSNQVNQVGLNQNKSVHKLKERVLPQCEVARILGVYDNVKLYLLDSWGEPMERNPYHVADNKLYDSLSQIDDDTLGKLIRNDVSIDVVKKDGLEEGEHYFYINPDRKILHKENIFDVTDLMNIMLGNYFIAKESVNEKDVKRVLSVFSLIKESKRNLFPYEVKESDYVVAKILEVTVQEKNKRSIIDEDDEVCHGFLKKNFENEI